MDEKSLRARSVQWAQLMERAQRGDREAYAALLTDVAPPLERFLRRRITDPHELEDVCQETLVAVHPSRHTYDPSRPFGPWLFAIARHVAVDHFRRRVAQTSHEVLVGVLPEPAAEADPTRPRLEAGLAPLPAALRGTLEVGPRAGNSAAAAG